FPKPPSGFSEPPASRQSAAPGELAWAPASRHPLVRIAALHARHLWAYWFASDRPAFVRGRSLVSHVLGGTEGDHSPTFGDLMRGIPTFQYSQSVLLPLSQSSRGSYFEAFPYTVRNSTLRDGSLRAPS